jgi:hypothetical protein
MKQAIAGVAPSETEEVTVMVVWPSIARFLSGRWLGRLYSNSSGIYIVRIGNILALASIPYALLLYFVRLLRGWSYRLTNRRVIEMRFRTEAKSVELNAFDAVEVDRLPGHQWFDAGDLVFKQDGREVFRLQAVSRPEAFRQTCLKARMSRVAVKHVLDREAVRT